MEIDLTVTKLERNTRYAHLSADMKRYQAIPVTEIVDELDDLIGRHGINDISLFLLRLYEIVAHQTYHVDIDTKSGLAYSVITRTLDHGKGNPRIDSVENILNALGASLAICKIEDEENGIPAEELQRACFFQQDIGKERWPIRSSMETLAHFGLQFRIFSFEDVKKNNVLQHRVDLTYRLDETDALKVMSNDVSDVALLLHFFNVDFSNELNIRPPVIEPE